MNDNPYAAPNSSLKSDGTPTGTRSIKQFPIALISRWILCLWAIYTGFNETFHYSYNWKVMAEKAIIDSVYAPLPGLFLGVLHLSAGLAFLLRRKFAPVLFVFHFAFYIVRFNYYSSFSFATPFLVFYLFMEAITIWLGMHQWAHHRLK